MKVVITTQVRENYGTPDDAYWKFKGGSTFVVPNLTPLQTLKVTNYGIPTLKALIESKNPMCEEYVVDFFVVEDSMVECEPWDTPTRLFWEEGRWVARTETLNEEYGYMRKEVAKKVEFYEMGMGGERRNATVTYTLRDGREMGYEEVCEYLKAVD